MQRPVLTVPQIAEYLNLSVSTVYQLVRVKDFPAVKLGKSWRILKDKLDPWFISQLANKQENI